MHQAPKRAGAAALRTGGPPIGLPARSPPWLIGSRPRPAAVPAAARTPVLTSHQLTELTFDHLDTAEDPPSATAAPPPSPAHSRHLPGILRATASSPPSRLARHHPDSDLGPVVVATTLSSHPGPAHPPHGFGRRGQAQGAGCGAGEVRCQPKPALPVQALRHHRRRQNRLRWPWAIGWSSSRRAGTRRRLLLDARLEARRRPSSRWTPAAAPHHPPGWSQLQRDHHL